MSLAIGPPLASFHPIFRVVVTATCLVPPHRVVICLTFLLCHTATSKCPVDKPMPPSLAHPWLSHRTTSPTSFASYILSSLPSKTNLRQPAVLKPAEDNMASKDVETTQDADHTTGFVNSRLSITPALNPTAVETPSL